jgi:hypothetical protein
MEIIIIMVVAVYALAIAMQLKGYMASVKAPKAETDKADLGPLTTAHKSA